MKHLIPSLPDNATLGDVYRQFPAKLAPLANYQNAVMRGKSPLTVAEREIIAAYVSGLNACTYCHGAHKVHARAFGVDVATIEALADDLDSAPVDPKLRPLLRYTAKLTQAPSRMTEADAAAVYNAGWSEEALFDAIQVCGLFNLMNRMLEGTGVTDYAIDPNTLRDDQLEPRRSADAYLDFARANGVHV